ncbi:hypothetical protein E4U11_007657 [Claviceps purpurea]|nr:hypothetical protein E4U11_007657 [Claviceps purpurea]
MAMESPIRVDAGESDCVERDPRFPVQFIKVDRDRRFMTNECQQMKTQTLCSTFYSTFVFLKVIGSLKPRKQLPSLTCGVGETSRIDTTKRTREQKAGVSEKGIGYVEIARRR